MKKKIIPIILVSIITLSSTVCAFSDIENHWSKEAVEKLSKLNIVNGYDDNTFKPDNYMTRAEVATIINRLIGATKESSKYIPDVNRQDWYYSEIRKAMQSGVMQGNSDGYTRPNSYITREEVSAMLSRAFYISGNSSLSGEYLDENEISDWSKEYISTFVNYKYITGYDDGTIKPKKSITRAEFITILNRIFQTIAVDGMYTGEVSGDFIVTGKNIVLNDLVVNGNLIIAEGTKKTIELNDVEVKGNLILREEIDIDEIYVHGEKILAYDKSENKLNQYINEEYGIEFSISDLVTIVEEWKTEKINYNKENMLIVNIEQLDEYYLKSIETIGKEKIREVDNIYNVAEKGIMGNSFYILYDDISNGDKYKFLVIKRDNVVYTLLFRNITADNLIDNVLATLRLVDGEKILDRRNVIYKNSKLNLKFSYREGYVGVDDSYNTNNIYSGDAPLKLFIQVNTITDMKDYSFEEIQYLLKTLAMEDGKLIETETLKIINNDAVLFKILTSENKVMNSLYIVIGNNLYALIFTADEIAMNEVGDYFFDEIIKSIEI